MIKSQRLDLILKLISEKKHISVNELSSTLGYAKSTIRADLNSLAEAGKIIRTHGGASLSNNENSSSTLFESRIKTCVAEKKEIATKAISIIKNDECIILDASSTCYELAKLIAKSSLRITVLTNGYLIADTLKSNKNISTVIIGGLLSNDSYWVEGTMGAFILDNFNITKAFISSRAINENGLDDFNIYAVQLKKVFIEKSNEIYALIDNTKFNKNSAANICNLKEIDYLITDSKLNKNIKKDYEKLGVEIL